MCPYGAFAITDELDSKVVEQTGFEHPCLQFVKCVVAKYSKDIARRAIAPIQEGGDQEAEHMPRNTGEADEREEGINLDVASTHVPCLNLASTILLEFAWWRRGVRMEDRHISCVQRVADCRCKVQCGYNVREEERRANDIVWWRGVLR